MTAAGRRGPRLRWRPLPGNLIDRRGAALALPILLAVALNVAAVPGLAGIAGFHTVYASLIRIQWPWLCAVPAALAMSGICYYVAYRSIYAAEGGYQLRRRQLTAVVAAGFSGLFSTGGIRPDGLVLQASGASRREAMVRVTTLTGMEQAILALYGCAASIAWLSLGLPGVALDVTLPWVVIPVPAFAAAFWLASRYRARLPGRGGWRARLSVFLDAVLLIRALFARPVQHRGAIGGMALFWVGDALAVWLALAAFGFVMNGAALLVGYCTGMVFTRRVAPLAGGNADADPAADDLGQRGAAGHRHHRHRRLPPAGRTVGAARAGEPARAARDLRQAAAVPGKRHRSAVRRRPRGRRCGHRCQRRCLVARPGRPR